MKRLADQGATLIGVPVDVVDQSSVRSMREQVFTAYGSEDVIDNSTDVYHAVDSVWNIDPVQWLKL